ncbi:MAG TPA: PatB family C-S lyase [Rhodocyclaceae bacterium]|nr:PatB family C-S lyase [Rhodocyclaceae bacterium]
MSHDLDFDKPIDRRSLPGDKWGRYHGRDVLPLWVADMDFAAPAAVLEALHRRIDHGVFGYTDAWPGLVQAVIDGIARDHGWRIEPDWLVWLPGVVSGFNIACRAVGEPADEVFTATPVYPPFLSAPANCDRRLVTVPLVLDRDRWQWNRRAVEAAMGSRTRLFMLCNPHNPVGRVFGRDELTWIAALAERHDLVVCSDEIHCGLVLDPAQPHLPLAALDPSVARRTITLMAPSKTWNIPALYCAFAVIPDPALRRRYRRAMRGIVPHPNVLGMVATEAAYRDGGAWRAALLDYLRGNRDCVVAALESMPGISASRPEATYLAWLDCRDTGVDDPAAFFEAGGVGLSDGAPFGMPGFVRLNFGCPRATLAEALSRMRRALEARAAAATRRHRRARAPGPGHP